MAVEISGDTSSGEVLCHKFVAKLFVEQYYHILKKFPEIVHKFYNDQSVINHPGPDGAMTSVTTMQGINEKIMSSDYKGCSAKIINSDAQESLMGGILIAVTGYLTGKDNLKRSFSQTFFLAKQEKGFFVLNDIFWLGEESEPLTLSTSNESDENPSSVPLTQDPETPDVPIHPKPINTSTCTEVIDSGKKVSNVKDTAVEVPNSSVASSQNESTLICLPSNVNQDAKKTSYASMVAKESKVTSPTHNSGYKIVRVAANADQQSIAPPALRDPVTTSITVTKELNPSNGAIENDNAHGDAAIAKSVYIGNLPSSITKYGLVDAMKQFGRVRPGGIQIRTFEDGFCFGFVEFESASSARAAVEVHNITVGENEAYIMYKKSSRSGNVSAGSGRFHNGNLRGQENGEFRVNGVYQDYNQTDFGGQIRGFSAQSGEINQKKSQSRDARTRGREAYHRSSWGSNEKWSNGEAYSRDSRRREERGKSGDTYQRNNQRSYERAAREQNGVWTPHD